MHTFWTFVFRVSGACLGICAAVFMSVPSLSPWKRISGVASAIAGTICILAMYLAKQQGAEGEVHLVKRELEHFPPGSSSEKSDDGEHHVD